MPGIQDLREARAEKARALKNLADSNANSWTPAHGKKCDGLIAEIDALDDQIANFQRVLDRTAEEIQNGIQGDRRGTVRTRGDRREGIEALGRFGRTNDVSALGPQASLTEDIGSGGAIMRRVVADPILDQARLFDPIFDEATVYEIDTAASGFTVPVNVGGTGTGWTGETDARPVTASPKLVPVSFPDGELYANCPASQWWLDDTQAGNWLSKELGRSVGIEQGKAFLFGTGVKQPVGLLHNATTADGDDTRDFSVLQHVVSGSASAILADNLLSLVYSVKPQYRTNGI